MNPSYGVFKIGDAPEANPLYVARSMTEATIWILQYECDVPGWQPGADLLEVRLILPEKESTISSEESINDAR